MSETLNLDFDSEQAYRRPRGVRFAGILGILCFLAFAIVDPYLTDNLSTLLVVRGIICACCLLLIGLSYLPSAHKISMGLAVAMLLSVGGGVILVTALTEGAHSPYHQALLLTMLGFSLLIPWTTRWALVSFLGLTLLYNAVLLIWGAEIQVATLATNNAMLLSGVAISVVGINTANRMRREQFRSTLQLENNHRQLQELDAAKNRLFANLSHELRTPLALILAPVEALLIRKDFAERDKHQFSLVRRNALRLLRLVDDLLNLTKLQSAKQSWSPRRIQTLDFLKGIIAAAEPLTRRKNIPLFLETDGEIPEVWADPNLLERIFINLLSNSAKFTPENGRISIVVHGGPRHCSFTVRDNGVGIPPRDLDKIFDRFFQAEEGLKRHGSGTGLGLSLVRELVELQGGTICAHSTPGRGTDISFTLSAWIEGDTERPDYLDGEREDRRDWHSDIKQQDDYRFFQLDEATERRAAPRPEESDERRELILVIEDNQEMAEMLAGLLSNKWDVAVAHDGTEGLDMAMRTRPDLILSDIMMPRMDGIELLQTLKRNPQTQQIPTIMLTARGDSEDRVQSHEVGADKFLQKPFHPGELLAAVTSLLEREERSVASAADQSDRALRVLAEGVAHEVLNPLGFVTNALYILKTAARKRFPLEGTKTEPEAGVEQIDQAYAAGREGLDRIRNIIENLRQYARGGGLGLKEEHRINDILQKVATLAGSSGAGMDLSLQLESQRHIQVRAGQIEQVLLNLLVNARDAGGEKCRVEMKSWDVADGVICTVTDNGPGVPEDKLDHIFTPFFTTKGEKGTGLGLALARQIAREHGGGLRADYAPGGGMCFRLFIPTEAEPEESEKEEKLDKSA